MANLGSFKRGIVSSGSVVGGGRGITTPSGGFDPDAAAFFAAVEAAGGTLSPTVKTAWNAFVLREKDNSRYSKLLRLYPFLGGVINSARIDAITLGSATNNNFVDADADATCGLQGDGSTKKLDVALAADIWASTNDWQVYWYSLVAETADKQCFGSISGGNDMVALRRRNVSTGNNYIYGNNISIVATIGGTFASQQAIYGGRFTSTDLTLYQDSLSNTSTTLNTYAFPITYPISMFGRNGASVQYSDEKCGGCMMAEGMTKDEIIAYNTSYNTFLTDIGAI